MPDCIEKFLMKLVETIEKVWLEEKYECINELSELLKKI
jgi:hypothetical protein